MLANDDAARLSGRIVDDLINRGIDTQDVFSVASMMLRHVEVIEREEAESRMAQPAEAFDWDAMLRGIDTGDSGCQ